MKEITGVYVKTVFRNEVDGFTIFRLRLNKPVIETPLTEICCKGIMQSALICTPMRLKGDFVSDSYGLTFNVESAEPYSDNKAVTVEYLSSNLFNGIAEATATKIVDISGPDIFSFIQKDDAKESLLKIKGLTAEKIEMLYQSVMHTKVQKEIFEYISSFGGSFSHAEALFEEFGPKALQNLKNNPYETGLATDIPFRICDIIAKENGISFDNKARIKALILDVLYRCYLSGDMYVLIERLFRGVDYVSHNTSAYPDNSVSYGLVVATLVETKQVVIETHSKEEDAEPEIRCYLKTAFFDEKIVAQNIKRLQKSKRYFDFDTESAISDAEKSLNITYGDKQKDCFGFLKSSGIKIITGGPGTGKSTVINGIISEYKKRFPSADVKLMAPTGRAAQRISEITGMTAGTIHRMLNIMPFSKNMVDSAFNGDYPADLLIVDEASMIDTALMRLLVKSIKSSALVILCGDIDQLPSVGAGNVLHELIASGAIETVQLDRNFRQLNQSVIIENAIKVNKGDSQVITSPNFQIIECKDEEEIQQVVVKQFVDLYDTNKPYDTQVLSSTRKGPAGTYSLNKHIQSIINDNSTVTAHNNSKFRLKDKVMTTHNNYDIKYFNGDVGVIQSADENFVYVDFLKERLAIPKSCVQDIELAYACTVHKSQGSEYETVIIALPSQPSVMLRRNLLYTAITRAKKNIIIVTQKGCISRAAINAIDANRKSALAEKITETERGTFEKNTRK